MRVYRLTSAAYFRYQLQYKSKFLWWEVWVNTDTYSDSADELRTIVREIGGIMATE